jgi:hypothetical protein
MRGPLTLRGLVTRRNTVRLIPIVIALSLLGALLWHQSDDIRRLVEGPQPMTLAQLSTMGNDAAGRWIELTIDVPPRPLLETAEPVLDRKGRQVGTVVLHYFALAGDLTSTKDRMVIVQSQTAELPAILVARVAREDSNSYTKTRSELYRGKQFQFSSAPLSPVLLTTLSLTGTRVIWALIMAMTTAVAIMLWRTLRGLLNPLRAAPIAHLRKSVRAPEGLPALVAEIDGQLGERDPTARRMGLILLPSWLVYVTPLSFTLISASDVIWMGPGKIVSAWRRAGLKNEILIVTRNGRMKHSIRTSASLIPDRLAALHRWAPWAVIGADETMKESFGRAGWWLAGSKTKDQIVATIDRRRDGILAHRAAQN